MLLQNPEYLTDTGRHISHCIKQTKMNPTLSKLRYSLRMLLLLPMLLLASCQADESEYSHIYPCHFYFDTAAHNASYLTKALANTEMFCFVWRQEVGGIRTVMVQPGDGQPTEPVSILSAIEADEYDKSVLGGANGVIIGRSASLNGELFCFDRICPYCLQEPVQRHVEWYKKDGKLDNSKVQCPRCHRVYDLQNRGICNEGAPKLMRYAVSYDGYLLRM